MVTLKLLIVLQVCLSPSLGQLNRQFNPKFNLFTLGNQDNKDGGCIPDDPKCPKTDASSICKPNFKCKHITVCGAFADADVPEACTQSDGNPGVCCEQLKEEKVEVHLFKEAQPVEGPKGRSATHPTPEEPAVRLRLLKDGDEFSQSAYQFSRLAASKNLPIGSSYMSHFMQNKPSSMISKLGYESAANTWSAKRYSESASPTRLPNSNITPANINVRALVRNCPPDPVCEPNAKFRSFDGSCNNLQTPKFGMAGTPLQRIRPNAYRDRFFLPRADSNGSPLPSARVVSLLLNGQESIPNKRLNNLFAAFGQFVVHDMVQVPVADDGNGKPPVCCPVNVVQSDAAALVCFPIPVPARDPVFAGVKDCLSFVRSLGGVRVDCQAGPLEQVNQVSHWIDGSAIYGNSFSENLSLRVRQGGLLKSQMTNDGMLMPPAQGGGSGFLAGDSRANQQPPLTLIHTLFLREHNRIAAALKANNPFWTDEKLFQESRRICVAELQHIVFNEFLPALMGKKVMTTLGLLPKETGFFDKYDVNLNPSIVNAAQSSALRLHSILSSLHTFVSPVNGATVSTMLLKDSFGKGSDIFQQSGGITTLMMGELVGSGEESDANFISDITKDLFAPAPNGLDLLSIHIQRGRDHGIPGYVQYREICSNVKINSFDDLLKNMEQKNIDLLKMIYRDVDDIDLFVALVLETPSFDGSTVGNTFLCIVADQFLRLKMGDRFFYELGGQPGSFTESQLNSIRKASMARLACDNFPDIILVQGLALQKPDKNNPFLRCSNGIPKVDLRLWASEP